MFPQPGVGYDRAITIFSPEGRLFQVEYAMKAVERGAPVIGIKVKDGVILTVVKKKNPLLFGGSSSKLFMIDEHILAGVAGITSDARILIDDARIEAQNYRLVYGEPIDVESLTKRICDIKQTYTQHAGVRPFGVSFLIAGIDELGPHLYMTDPSGSFSEYKAVAIGMGKNEADEILKKEYFNIQTIEEAIILGLKILKKISEEKISPDTCEVGIVDTKRKVYFLSAKEIENYLSKIPEE